MPDDREMNFSRRSWDTCREIPVFKDGEKPRKGVNCMHWLSCTIVGLLVFALAFFSKSSLLLLITLAREDSATIQTKPYVTLFLGITLICPSVLLFLKSFWKFLFKGSENPSWRTVLWVLCVETVVALGAAVLPVVVMPHFDIISNVMVPNSVGISSAILQVVAQGMSQERKSFIIPPLVSVVLIFTGYVVFTLSYVQDGKVGEIDHLMYLWIGLAVVGTLCISLNWWENYSTLFKVDLLDNITRDIARSRNVVCILSSVVRVLVTAAVVGAYVTLSGMDWASVQSVPKQTQAVCLSLAAIQVGCSVLCQWFAGVACKMHAHRRSFIVPMHLASLAVLATFLASVLITLPTGQDGGDSAFRLYCQPVANPEAGVFDQLLRDISQTLCARPMVTNLDLVGLILLGGSALCWWLGLVLCTIYIWFLEIQRIERTRDLFVRRLYETAFLEQSMLLNTRFAILRKKKEKRNGDAVIVYLCATMWHETYDEMVKIIISMFRMDKYRPMTGSRNDVSFESHIYFDDAFNEVEDRKERRVNEYAETLVEVIKEVYTIFNEEDTCIFKEAKPFPHQKILQTPYGGRLKYTLPYGNVLMVHYKDKQLIRHKKRWSQIMYLYYILGWKLNRKYFKKFDDGENGDLLKQELKKEKENTYILALDGDTDFQPAAVMLLVDRLKLYPEVGAACGRIHPTGTGPMVWYQKFEYAVGHWLQKTAEHVFGCVLCSPGCFSLFRGAALMDDNVMKKYTTKATEASHYIQYDQGEDRWLCTLLLQQGWRVEYNAASDAYTNAPQDFKEFYNQRRRWGPSTMANTIDLLGSGALTSQRNSSISKPYIFYQIISMTASILGPATICLMIAGSFTFILSIHSNVALFLATVPPFIYLILCFMLKSDTQITVAAVMSVFYAFLMTATLLSVIGQMVQEQTFMTPSGLFFMSMVSMYAVTAAFHPQEFHLIIFGLMYFLCIPSGYLLLAIYSMVNMNNVSWGTRETGGPPKVGASGVIPRKWKWKCPCWTMEEKADDGGKQHLVMVNETDPKADMCTLQDKRKEESISAPQMGWVAQLKNKSHGFFLNEDTLDADEENFWREIQERYLEPLAEDKEKQKRIAEELKSLRNKVTCIFFICNALWLVATFFLQTIGTIVSIRIPKIHINGTIVAGENVFIDPIGLMFLLGFFSLILVQFVAMLYHRIYTLIHFVAYTGTETKAIRTEAQSDSDNPSNVDQGVGVLEESRFEDQDDKSPWPETDFLWFQNPQVITHV
ncbi:hypothetical protein AAFF_G00418040 [Aldrovandia affinis]|uniref:chitin synthase n=1 Tax=Aldrovandia affinis TaxID=143900 RepID=A0AAD7SA92_9TELE|nr:hypothetical protein AAFF_G00418040 [Aldrovandia affinis]